MAIINYSRMLAGKSAVVTCGDSAIGIAIVKLFAEHGATVAIGAKDARVASKLIPSISGISPDSFYWHCDLADADSVEAFCAEVNRHFPLVNVLVNNPRAEYIKAFDDAGEEDDEMMLQIYQRSIMQTLRAFWPAMLKNGGCSVVNISSASVFKAAQGSLMHTMANGAVGGMTRVPAVEGGYREVRVNEILAAYGANDGADIAGVANAALFLASDMASYVSGVSLSVSGGLQRMRYA